MDQVQTHLIDVEACGGVDVPVARSQGGLDGLAGFFEFFGPSVPDSQPESGDRITVAQQQCWDGKGQS